MTRLATERKQLKTWGNGCSGANSCRPIGRRSAFVSTSGFWDGVQRPSCEMKSSRNALMDGLVSKFQMRSALHLERDQHLNLRPEVDEAWADMSKRTLETFRRGETYSTELISRQKVQGIVPRRTSQRCLRFVFQQLQRTLLMFLLCVSLLEIWAIILLKHLYPWLHACLPSQDSSVQRHGATQ